MQKLSAFILWLLLFLVAFFVYWPARDARFVFDFIDWYKTLTSNGVWGMITSYKGPSLHYVYHLATLTAINVFGLNAVLWLLLFCVLHALNATLIVQISRLVFRLSKSMSVATGVLFLISPFHTEVVVWGATLHYLLVTTLMLTVIFLVASKAAKETAVISALLFLSGLFTHEMVVVLPVLLSFLFVFQRESFKKWSGRQFLAQVILPQFILIGFYLLLNKLILNKWIGHYGAETHLNIQAQTVVVAFYKYILKYLAFSSLWDYSKQLAVYGWLQQHWWHIAAALIMVLVFITISVAGFFAKYKSKWMATLAALLGFGIAIFPVLNLYFSDVVPIQADRLGYMASAFLFVAVASALTLVMNRWGLVLIAMLVFANACYLTNNVGYWHKSANMLRSLNNEFPSNLAGNIYLLNLPDNYNGAYMYRCLGTSKFVETYQLQTGLKPKSIVHDVAVYNVQSDTDGVIVSRIAEDELKVELNHWGNWFWNTSGGPLNYENAQLKTTFDEYGHSYVVHFKQRRPDDIVLYQSGYRWVRFQF